MAKAKTIQMIFVNENDIGYLIENEELKKYNTLHNQAITVYKKTKGMIEKISGKKVTYQIIGTDQANIDPLDCKIPANRIIIIKNDDTALVLQGASFDNYQNYHFEGLALLKQKKKIKGIIVKVKIT